MLTVKQAAAELGISVSLAYGLLASKKIRHYRFGLGRGKIAIPPEALEEYRRRRLVTPVEAPETPSAPLRHLVK